MLTHLPTHTHTLTTTPHLSTQETVHTCLHIVHIHDHKHTHTFPFQQNPCRAPACMPNNTFTVIHTSLNCTCIHMHKHPHIHHQVAHRTRACNNIHIFLTHTHTHTHTYTHTRTHTKHTHTHIQTCEHTYTHRHANTHIHTHIHAHRHAHRHTHNTQTHLRWSTQSTCRPPLLAFPPPPSPSVTHP